MGFFPPVNPNAAYIDEDSGIKPGTTTSGNSPFQVLNDIWSGKGVFNKSGGGQQRSRPGGGLRDFGPEYAAKERHEFNKARAHDIRTKPSSVTRTDKPEVTNTRDVEPPTSSTVVQKGTQTSPPSTPIDMSRGFDSMLAEMGLGQYSSNPAFSSNQLPTTVGSPDGGSNSPGYTTIQPTDPIHAEAFGQDLTDQRTADNTSQNYTTIKPSDPQFAEAFGQDLADRHKKESDSKSTGYTKGGRLDQALAGVKTQEANREMTPEQRQARASMAFYNADGGLEGLQARDAVNDVIYAGGQHWGRGALTEDSKYGDKYKIDRDDARDIASGKTTAAGLLQTYKDRITSSQKDTPSESQDPKTTFDNKPDLKVSDPGSDAFNLEGRDFQSSNDDGKGFIDTTIDIGNKKGKGFPSTFGAFQ